FVLRSRTLLRERHEDSRTDRLDPERSVACRNLRIDEPARRRDGGPGGVEDVEPSVVEVRRIELWARGRRRDREPFVDRPGGGRRHGEQHQRREREYKDSRPPETRQTGNLPHPLRPMIAPEALRR